MLYMLSTAPDEACEEAPLPDQAQDHFLAAAYTTWKREYPHHGSDNDDDSPNEDDAAPAP